MSKIRLSELPESKEFMKHAKIADGLTKETGLEHGFLFCKPNDKIIVDKMCVGNSCHLDISPEECGKFTNSFHTHPDKLTSRYSVGDLYDSASKSYFSGQPNISCVKGEHNRTILCQKVNLHADINLKQSYNDIEEIKRLYEDFKSKPTELKENKATYKIRDITKPEITKFELKI